MNEAFDIQEQLIGIGRDLVGSVTAAAPRVVTMVVVLIVAYVAAKVVQKVMAVVLRRIRFDDAMQKVGIAQLLKKAGIAQPPSAFLPRVVFYLLIFLFGQSIVESMGITPVANAIGGFLAYLPNVVAALLLMIFGALLAQHVGGIVTRAARESGIDFAGALGSMVSGLIVFIAAIMAVSQLKFDTDIVRIVTLCALAGLGLSFGLSFGLGSREFTRNMIAGYYAKRLCEPGDFVEVQGRSGVVAEITPMHVVIESEGQRIAVSNSAFLDQVVTRPST